MGFNGNLHFEVQISVV